MPTKTPRVPDAPTSVAWRMADRIMEGQLRKRLTDLRAEGRSYEDIGRVLAVEVGLEISARTLSNWGKRLGLNEAAA